MVKIYRLDSEDMQSNKRKSSEPDNTSRKKKVKIDQKIIARIGNMLYAQEDITSVALKIKFRNGTSTSFSRSEDEDRFERVKQAIDEDNDD